ncbi:hypothetical protein LX15_003664 [Streptoalloteichus tenebrarius]|uniref:Integral membrane protein n=1 Tax=Streptoalloteichus tenebrarius (strain ATCC 17920 / DSM 40477 / JCM 4838 / CBS 697.72 / NBRC 16177 / NCIMB 11028 / NRRL B-12390 / A12253. 1 / ISP 5477) TaxID=1933 RepID=A0ABT1HX34_STRSD|nr:hypothetical protein [Streptoalloteichus tenebrarius]MCP2259955.1 hypothetical protein [Streptoalloteichus tenebrarius]BFF03280.1 hypothetical protein GCM10020241_49550 [Streptoalloteichus tenebrarius]
MGVGAGPDDTSGGLLAARWLAAVAAVVTVLGLYVLPWWPGESFLEFRAGYLLGGADGLPPWWSSFPASYFCFGFVPHTVAVLVPPLVVARADRWRLLSAPALVGALWQVLAVRGAPLVNTTGAPYLGAVAGMLLVIAWWLGRVAARPDGWGF